MCPASQRITKRYVYSVWFEEGCADVARGKLADAFKLVLLRWPDLPDHRVKIEGFADPEREGERLALARAGVVFRYLVDHGVDPARIDALTGRCGRAPKDEEERRVSRRATVEAYPY